MTGKAAHMAARCNSNEARPIIVGLSQEGSKGVSRSPSLAMYPTRQSEHTIALFEQGQQGILGRSPRH